MHILTEGDSSLTATHTVLILTRYLPDLQPEIAILVETSEEQIMGKRSWEMG
jgi:hypothetical protein